MGFFSDRITPIIRIKDVCYTLNDLLEIDVVEQDAIHGVDFISYSDDVSSSHNCQFIRFIITTTNRSQQFSDELATINHIGHMYDNVQDHFTFDDVKQLLLLLFKLTYSQQFIQLAVKYWQYYTQYASKQISNIHHFNKQELLVQSNAVNKVKGVSVYFSDGKCYMPLQFDVYNWAQTGRINSGFYSVVHEVEKCMIPKNDIIISFDCRAAEWNYLLYINGESENITLNKKTFWDDVRAESKLGEHITSKQIKGILYMWLYGAGTDTIIDKNEVQRDDVKQFHAFVKERYPKTFAFIKSKSNEYFDENSEIIYDYFSKELYVDSNYKKVNYFLQSSLSTSFQLFIHRLITSLDQMQLQSNVLFTVHDSFYIDLVKEEKEQVFSLIKELNVDPHFLLCMQAKITK